MSLKCWFLTVTWIRLQLTLSIGTFVVGTSLAQKPTRFVSGLAFVFVRGSRLIGSYLDVFGMEHGETGYLLEVALLVKAQNSADLVVLHYNTVNDITNSRMIL